jgi:hypothetical protein
MRQKTGSGKEAKQRDENVVLYRRDVYKKRHSLFGHFLHATFHFTKNAPISQRRSPFGIPLKTSLKGSRIKSPDEFRTSSCTTGIVSPQRRAAFSLDAGRRSTSTQGGVQPRRKTAFNLNAGRRSTSTQGDTEPLCRATKSLFAGRRRGSLQNNKEPLCIFIHQKKSLFT